ncbi:MAG: type II toxin-antitoxin system RelE/ParE family toxin [Elusimicrobiota bacterium]
MKNISFLKAAEDEMLDAALFYESQAKHLGKDFLYKIETALTDISLNPMQWPIIDRDIHRRLLHRFPYAILYKIDKMKIIIVAIMHLHRHPDYWMERI